jgi:hypothetical protein
LRWARRYFEGHDLRRYRKAKAARQQPDQSRRADAHHVRHIGGGHPHTGRPCPGIASATPTINIVLKLAHVFFHIECFNASDLNYPFHMDKSWPYSTLH